MSQTPFTVSDPLREKKIQSTEESSSVLVTCK
jgi:hypothetical protein